MAEHRISAKLDLNTRDAQRSMEQAAKSSRVLERQIEKTNRAGTKGIKTATTDVANRKRIELIEREARAVNKLALAYDKSTRAVTKANRAATSMRGANTARGGGISQLMSAMPMGGMSGVAGLGIGAAGILATAMTVKKGINTYREEDVLMRYNKTIGGSDAFNARLLNLSNTLPVARTAMLQGGYQALSAGTKNEQEAYNVARASAEATTLGGPSVNMEEMTKFLTAMQLSFAGAGGANFSADEMNKRNAQLFQLTKMGKIEYKDLGAISNSMSTAGAVGIRQEELFGLIGTLTNKGLSASEADTAANRLMMQLMAPTLEAKKYSQSLGLDTSQSRIAKEGLAPVLKDIHEKIGSDVSKMQDIFGDQRAIGAFNKGMKDGGESMQRFVKGMDEGSYEEFNDKKEMMAEAITSQERILGSKFASFAKGIVEATGLTAVYSGAISKLSTGFDNMAVVGNEYVRMMTEKGGDLAQWMIDNGMMEGETTKQATSRIKDQKSAAGLAKSRGMPLSEANVLVQDRKDTMVADFNRAVAPAPAAGAAAGGEAPGAAQQEQAAGKQSSAADKQNAAAAKMALASLMMMMLPGQMAAAIRSAANAASTLKST